MGFSKDFPSIERRCWSPLPGPGFPVPFGRRLAKSLFSFRPWVFSTLRRLSPPTTCDFVSSRCRSWGSARFRLPRSRPPRPAVPPFKAFPPLAATKACVTADFRGEYVRVFCCFQQETFTATLALSSFPARIAALGRNSGSCSARRVRCKQDRFQSRLPGALLGLPAVSFSVPRLASVPIERRLDSRQKPV